MNNDLISRSELKKAIGELFDNGGYDSSLVMGLIDNASTVKNPTELCKGCEYLKDCETCEDKAKQYSMGFQDGYRTGGFELATLRRWLIAQGYSEGTVNDKIEDFGKFVKKVREDEGE